MADTKEDKPEVESAAESLATANMTDVQNVLKAFGQVISSSQLYGHDHKVTRAAADSAFSQLTSVLSQCDVISLTCSEGTVLADGRPVEVKNPLIAAFTKQILAIEVSGLSFKPGMPRDEFDRLLELLSTQPEKLKAKGQFAQVLADSGIQHAQARTAMYQLVTEEEVVVNKSELQQALSGTGGSRGQQIIEQIIAFLKGELNTTEMEAVAGNITELATDTDKLAELIVKAAEVKKGSGDIEEGETLAEIVVGCLRRTFDTLMQDPSAKTQQGKKNLAKLMMLVEKNVLTKLREAGEIDESGEKEIEEAVDEMATELQMDALAGEYMKKRKGIEAAEKKILRFLKTRGAEGELTDELKDRLEEGGLTPSDWKELVIKSGAEASQGGPGGSIQGAGALAALLSQLDDILKTDEAGAGKGLGEGPGAGPGEAAVEAMAGTIAEISHEVAAVTEDAGQRIGRLIEKIAEPPTDQATAEEQALSRRELIELLAEIVQELNQPLAVITASLEMIVMRRLGAITEPQKEMLELAITGAERLKVLFDKLLEVSGVPVGRNPDERILKSIYRTK